MLAITLPPATIRTGLSERFLKYKWPANHDELWAKTNEILYNVSEPSKHGRSGRNFEISQ